MLRETLILTAFQSGILFLALWGIFQLVPSIPANAKVWLWRLAFVKPLLSLLPFAMVTLPILPARQPAQVIGTEYGYEIQPIVSTEVALPALEAPPATPQDPLLLAWAIGVVGVAIYGAWGMRRAWLIARNAEAVDDQALHASLDDLLERASIHRRPALLRSSAVTSAMLVGGRQYAIVLPEKAEFEDLRLMMAHEVAHIARQDLYWFGLASTVQSLFFFNPMVWVAARCSRLDHESATDRHASQLAGVPIRRYADMLLRVTTTSRPSLAPGVLPVAESYRTIHRRLEAMKHFNSKPTFWRRTAVAALAMLTLGMLPAYNVVAAAWPMDDLQELPVPEVAIEAIAPASKPAGDDGKQRVVKLKKPTKAEAARQAKRLRIQKELLRLKAREATLLKLQARLKGKTKPVTRLQVKPVKVERLQETRVQTRPIESGKPIPVQRVTLTPQKANPKVWLTQKPGKPSVSTTWVSPTRTSQTGGVLWRVQDRSLDTEYKIWKTPIEPNPEQSGSTRYEIKGKNVTITLKDGVYYISADGPITIRSMDGAKVQDEKARELTGFKSYQGGTVLAEPQKGIIVRYYYEPKLLNQESVPKLNYVGKATVVRPPLEYRVDLKYEPIKVPTPRINTAGKTSFAPTRNFGVQYRLKLKPPSMEPKKEEKKRKVPPTIDPMIFPDEN